MYVHMVYIWHKAFFEPRKKKNFDDAIFGT